MQDFQQKKKLRRILYSKTAVVVLVLIFLLLAKGVWNVYGKERVSAAQNALSQNQLASLQAQQAAISTNISDLSTDEGVERQIRENFSMAKSGEGLVIIVDNATGTASTTQGSPSFFERFWGDLKGLF